MNINDVYGNSQWLRASDLQGQKVRVKIADWDMVQFKNQDGSTNNQISLSFEGKEKKLGLNKTNSKMIASMHGDDTEGWIGKEIVLFPTKTMNTQGVLVDCIRIDYETPKRVRTAPPETKGFVSGLPSNGNGAPKIKPKAAFDELNPPPDDMNDSVPF